MMLVSNNEADVRFIGDDYYEDSVVVTMKGRDIEMTRILTIFTSIDLSQNNFEGKIPEILGNFKSLIVLSLAHNNLTGNIPSSLGNSIALESLDLSSNKLGGRIPVQLVSLTFLSLLNLSHNQLSGPIPQGGQFETFESDYFIGNKGLCGRPLPTKCNNDPRPQLPPAFSEGEDDNTSEFDWKIAMMGYGSGVVIGLSIGYIVFSTGDVWLRQEGSQELLVMVLYLS
ncbi:putative receptor like protein 25 [Pistacia vera]|uniref:putative receptor like protein 25 n=1 Tax=Pistacia vera TaxID=55513 RepID=UPI0012635B5E|nr:putative receptor like protein 25 [Pistacia vera]